MKKENKIKKFLKNKEMLKNIFFTLAILFLVRILTQITIPWVNVSYLRKIFSNPALSFYASISGGGIENFSVFSLSIVPYITASIIIQLLAIIFPSLENLQREGELGKKLLSRYTQNISFGLAFFQSLFIALAYRKAHFVIGGWLPLTTILVSLMAGYSILLWLSNLITRNGVGNGLSLILLVNVLSKIPNDVSSLYQKFMSGKDIYTIVFAITIITFVVITTVVLTIIGNEATRKIPIQYGGKLRGRRNSDSYIPLKVNTSSVMPVIFASTMLSLPAMYVSLAGIELTGKWRSLYLATIQDNWFVLSSWEQTVGYFIYLALLVFFAYYYTEMSFNPAEIANNFKRNSTTIPNVRPGKDTEDYLLSISKPLILIGVIFLAVICTIPMVISGLFDAKIAFSGTSLIIVVSVLTETIRQIMILVDSEQESIFG